MTTIEQPALNRQCDIPTKIAEHFSISLERSRRLGGGLVNVTYLAESTDTELRLIIQKIGNVIEPELAQDLPVYTRHLAQAGWECSTPIHINEAVDNEGSVWRGMPYIESDEYPPQTIDVDTAGDIGELLARWHSTMQWLDYEPRFRIPNFHNTSHHARSLFYNTDELPGNTQELARSVLNSHAELTPLPNAPTQLIHGDPKIENFLFRNGKPFTLIDLDTVMRGPVWFDVGDLLRSVASKDLRQSKEVDQDKINCLIEGYFNAARPGMSLADFADFSKLATQHISLELAMRYLNDIVDATYFSWDDKEYASRTENHTARASVYKNLATLIV